uniref:Uncharacterized protein n=1 Tax=Plectus sambesii TaxID=2011161 RepID=A0A914VVS0_9BILA
MAATTVRRAAAPPFRWRSLGCDPEIRQADYCCCRYLGDCLQFAEIVWRRFAMQPITVPVLFHGVDFPSPPAIRLVVRETGIALGGFGRRSRRIAYRVWHSPDGRIGAARWPKSPPNLLYRIPTDRLDRRAYGPVSVPGCLREIASYEAAVLLPL